jgi:hypothetical protein
MLILKNQGGSLTMFKKTVLLLAVITGLAGHVFAKNAAQYVSDTIPETMNAGQKYNASVTLKNTGDTTWSEKELYRLGIVGDRDLFTKQGRIFLKNPVLPGETCSFDIELTAVDYNGVYFTNWRMVQDAVEWFGEPATKQIIVTGGKTMGKNLDVMDFGAKGDGKTDDTAAFQEALNVAGINAGKVFVPVGRYMINTHLTIPANVTLEGIWEIPATWDPNKGSILLAIENAGNPDGTAFITLNGSNATIKGLTIFYPYQIKTATPTAYPWTIAGAGDNCSIIDVLLVNSYMGVDFGTKPCGRHFIRNLFGQVLYKGIYVDQCYDIGRIENVHFWPFWTVSELNQIELTKFTQEQGDPFIFGRTDWEYVYNTFSWGYKIGYHFIQTKSGVMNGNLLGIGADATNIAVLVDNCSPIGLLITNGEFVSFPGELPTELVVKGTNSGNIQLQNCSFWGPADQIAKIEGSGVVSFNNCNFVDYDAHDLTLPAIEVLGGDVIINGCTFMKPAAFHVFLDKEVKSAVVTSNRFKGNKNIINKSSGDVQIGMNVISEKKN